MYNSEEGFRFNKALLFGRLLGRYEAFAQAVENVVGTMQCSFTAACDILDIPEDERVCVALAALQPDWI